MLLIAVSNSNTWQQMSIIVEDAAGNVSHPQDLEPIEPPDICTLPTPFFFTLPLPPPGL